jgi:hypothetical protein
MNSPVKAAALLGFPFIFAVLGCVFCTQNGAYLNISANDKSSLSLSMIIGYKRFTSVPTSQQVGPSASYPIIIDGVCSGDPDVCQLPQQNPGDPNMHMCLMPSLWSLVVTSQFFASSAIILLAMSLVALSRSKGSRMIHQCLGVVSLTALLISLSCIMALPSRYFTRCLSQLPGSFTQSTAFDAGG